MKNYNWLLKPYLLSVEHLKLWANNPRLYNSKSIGLLKNIDFITQMLEEPNGKKDFINLAISIVDKGYIPADPIVVWKEDNNKYNVAEGNRRIAVMKCLLKPSLAPKSIRTKIQTLSSSVDKKQIEKVPVAIAPDFESAIWYITERHTPSSKQKRWTRENHFRWIIFLYKYFGADISKIIEASGLEEHDVNESLCIIAMRDKIYDLKNILTEKQYRFATSSSFPISTLERVLTNKKACEKLMIEFDKYSVVLQGDEESFLQSYGELIRRMSLDKNDPQKVDSRTINTKENIEKLITELPQVVKSKTNTILAAKDSIENHSKQDNSKKNETPEEKSPLKKNNPTRNRIIPEEYKLESKDINEYRIFELFRELQKIPPNLYPNCCSGALRILLDISVHHYIKKEIGIEKIQEEYSTSMININLNKRLEFLKKHIDNNLKKDITRLLDPSFHYSLDVLNGYIHGVDTSKIDRIYLNKFWDFLYPLFKYILNIDENYN